MAVTQGPIFGKTFDEKDGMIQPDLERAMAKKINAKTTTLPTSHVPMLSRPNDVATVILAAVTAVKQKAKDV
jgi:hypothetical protein